MKYVYGFLLFYIVDVVVIYSRTFDFAISAWELLLLGTINLVLWVSFEKFWETYKKYEKKLDTEVE
jgi:hypothetical protein